MLIDVARQWAKARAEMIRVTETPVSAAEYMEAANAYNKAEEALVAEIGDLTDD